MAIFSKPIKPTVKIGTLICSNNGGGGIRVEGDSLVEIGQASINDNGGYGIDTDAKSKIDINNANINKNEKGGIRIREANRNARLDKNNPENESTLNKVAISAAGSFLGGITERFLASSAVTAIAAVISKTNS